MSFSIRIASLPSVKKTDTIFSVIRENEVDSKMKKVMFQALRKKSMLHNDEFHGVVKFKFM